MEYEHYCNLTDEEVESRIAKLSKNQMEVFNTAMYSNKNRRLALLIASSYPQE